MILSRGTRFLSVSALQCIAEATANNVFAGLFLHTIFLLNVFCRQRKNAPNKGSACKELPFIVCVTIPTNRKKGYTRANVTYLLLYRIVTHVYCTMGGTELQALF